MSLDSSLDTYSDFNLHELNSLPSFLSACPLPTFILPPSSTWTPTSSSSHALPPPLWSNSAGRSLSSSSSYEAANSSEPPPLPLEERSAVLLRSLVARLLLEEAQHSNRAGLGLRPTSIQEPSSSIQAGKEIGGGGGGGGRDLPNNNFVELIVFSLNQAAFHPILTFLDSPFPPSNPPSTSSPLSPPSQLIILQLFPLQAAPSPSLDYPDSVLPSSDPSVEHAQGYPTPSWTGSPSSDFDLELSTASRFAFPDLMDELRPKIKRGEEGSSVEDLFAKTTSSRRNSSAHSSDRQGSIVTSTGRQHLESLRENETFISTKELMKTFAFEKTSLGPVSWLLPSISITPLISLLHLYRRRVGLRVW